MSAEERTAKYSRYQVMTAIFFLLIAIIILQLFHIQIIDHAKYQRIANNMQTDKQTINATRGQIYARDANGNIAPLVMNRTVYTLFADPSEVKDSEKVRQLAAQVAGSQLAEGGLDKLDNKKLQYVVLAKRLSQEQASRVKKADLAGVGLQADTQRVYPEGALAAQVLGFVNHDGKGQYGVEQFYDKELSGTPGLLQSVTDVRKIPL
ncbi:hypothetical protein MBN61_00405, partial [Candidatus Saccharibacteria bacterium]|nr:hypothetical protein [Candidatus Saccharibacteria bacterium]